MRCCLHRRATRCMPRLEPSESAVGAATDVGKHVGHTPAAERNLCGESCRRQARTLYFPSTRIHVGATHAGATSAGQNFALTVIPNTKFRPGDGSKYRPLVSPTITGPEEL